MYKWKIFKLNVDYDKHFFIQLHAISQLLLRVEQFVISGGQNYGS